jgi:hypothetical protein
MNIIEAIGRQLENMKRRIQTDIEYSSRLLAGHVGAHQCVFFHPTFLVDMTGQLLQHVPRQCLDKNNGAKQCNIPVRFWGGLRKEEYDCHHECHKQDGDWLLWICNSKKGEWVLTPVTMALLRQYHWHKEELGKHSWKKGVTEPPHFPNQFFLSREEKESSQPVPMLDNWNAVSLMMNIIEAIGPVVVDAGYEAFNYILLFVLGGLTWISITTIW